MPTWRYIDTGPNIGAYNMALDEELLARAEAGERTPVLRFYSWSPPSVSIGRFQDISRAVNLDACKRHGFDIVRRITGGRAVLHRHELTYSIIARTDDPLFPPTVIGTYKVIASGLLAGLRNLGLPAELVSRASRHASLVQKRSSLPSCFSSPSWYEIVVNGKKMVGSAQRRVRGAFLQHGSILLNYDPALEAEVIPGGSPRESVTSISHELGRELSLSKVKDAVAEGFSRTLSIMFAPSFETR